MRKLYQSLVITALFLSATVSSFGQATLLTGTTGATFTSPGAPTMAYPMNYAGNNRLMVLVVAGKVNAGTIGAITNVTYNGIAMTAVTTITASVAANTVRVSIYRMTESQIRGATAGACTSNIIVNWAVVPDNTIIQAMTFKDVDQTTPIAASQANATPASANNNLTLTAIAGAANALDAIVLGSVSNAAKVMSTGGGYAMITASQTVGTMAMGTALKSGAAISEAPNANWNSPAGNSQIGDVGIRITGVATTSQSQTTYYSLNPGGPWDSNTSWSTSADGTSGPLPANIWPSRTDNVVIRATHTITIDAMDDNKACGVLPDALSTGPAPVGSFPASNSAMFYQSGNIEISGTLLTTSGVLMMVSGYTHILAGGTLNTTSTLVNLGNLEAESASSLFTGDDIAISGTSTTIINTTSVSSDDLIIDHTLATLCGSGAQQLTNGGNSIITYANSATVSQICSSFTVTCSGSANGGCLGTFPTPGTGPTPLGNAGPGGVGSALTNKLWLRSSDLALANGASVTSWPDASGNGLIAAAQSPPLATTSPTFLTNNVNTIIPGVNFAGTTTLLTLGTPASLNFVPQTNPWTFIAAGNVNTGQTGVYVSKATNSTRQYQFQVDGTSANHFGLTMGGPLTVGTQTVTGGWKIPVATVSTVAASGGNSFVNGVADLSNQPVGLTTAPVPTDVLIGARRNANNTDAGFNLVGVLGEVIMYNVVLSTAQRNLVENYLSAKYAITGIANEMYAQDNGANGNYDFDVAGIAQIASGGNHKDAKGSGVVRMWNPSDLGDAEYLMWGRDNSVLSSSQTTDVSAPIQERLVRVWRVSESAGDVGTVNVSFVLTGLNGSFVGSNLRLLISRSDAVFSTNDVAPITGTYSGGVVTFTGVNFQDGDRFTIGNTNSSLPLPISLMKFTARPAGGTVVLDWSTASEQNNDFFTVERSDDGEHWGTVLDVKGAGNSTKQINYHAVDTRPFIGVSYYRLKQTDYSKDHAYSSIVKVTLSADQLYELTVYPNPTTGVFTLDVGFEVIADQVRMYDTMGKQIAIDVKPNGNLAVVDSGQIASGIYFVQVANGFWKKTIRVVKH